MRTILLAACLAVLVAGCGGDSGGEGEGAPASPASPEGLKAAGNSPSASAPTDAGAPSAGAPAESGGAADGPTRLADDKFKTTASSLKYAVLKEGSGAEAKAGNTVEVHYTGWLQSDGAKFDSSLDRGEPISFPLGQQQVIKGWDEGVAGMKEGEKRQLVIPAALGYGDSGRPPAIPGGATLVFEVELVKAGG
ncbi:MAG: FKBP-type peptidyl-prolyl cis-trans isomerase [Armatimonadetes bacterium]|nr:FKBP-type peptidyl-prolyl cis-trans isomerase [Armatimonadota bacterium]